MEDVSLRWVKRLGLCMILTGCTTASGNTGSSQGAERVATNQQAVTVSVSNLAVSSEFLDLNFFPAGVAAGRFVIFIGDPADGRVFAFNRFTGRQIGELPQPPGGFAVPFIMHAMGEGRVGILGAGGLPQINPFVPAAPLIYEYSYSVTPAGSFSATLGNIVDFSSVVIGFPEDFVQTPDGRILLTDSVIGSIWVAHTDGTISPGITPQTLDLHNGIPQLAFCPTMPEVLVNGVPFLFTGSTIPGVESIAVRNGTVYFSTGCARGVYKFPLSILSDNRQPFQRAADITLVSPTPSDTTVEELLDFQFNQFDPDDAHLYAAHGMQLEITRIDTATGARRVVAHDPRLFDFPSSLAFFPPLGGGFEEGISSMVVVSNQQERTPALNDAATQTTFILPFIVTKVLMLP
jgi:hypothetical protein